MLGSQLLISAMQDGLIVVVTLIPALVIGGLAGFFGYRQLLKKKQGDAETEYARVLEEARLEAKTLRKDALLEAKEEQLRLRNELEKESKDRRAELQRQESRINQKEDAINKKGRRSRP